MLYEVITISELDTLGVHLRQTHQKLLQMVIRDEQTGLFNLRKLKEDALVITSYSIHYTKLYDMVPSGLSVLK